MKNLKEILDQLETKEARAKVISRCVGEKEIPPELIEEAIKHYEVSREYDSALSIVIKAGMKGKVADLLKYRFNTDRAVAIALDNDMDLVAISLLARGKGSQEVIALAKERDICPEAVESLEKEVVGEKYDFFRIRYATSAARLAEETGMIQKAVNIYEMAQLHLDGAKLAEKHKMFERAIDLYATCGRCDREKNENGHYIWLSRAGHLAYRIGLNDKAIALFEEARDGYGLRLLAQDADEEGLKEKADVLYWKSIQAYADKGDEEAFKVADASKRPYLMERLMGLCEEKGAFYHVLEHAKETGDSQKIRECAEKISVRQEKEAENNNPHQSGFFSFTTEEKFCHAARFAEEHGLNERALRLYERACKFDDAYIVANTLELTEKAELYTALSSSRV